MASFSSKAGNYSRDPPIITTSGCSVKCCGDPIYSASESREAQTGQLRSKTVTVCGVSIKSVLILLGVIGIGAGLLGFVGFGVAQTWWSAGALGNLGQLKSIIMMAAGGGGGILLLIAACVCRAKNASKDEPSPVQEGVPPQRFAPEVIKDKNDLNLLSKILKEDEYTCILQDDGTYTLVIKHHTVQATSNRAAKECYIEEIATDMQPNKVADHLSRVSSAYTYQKTSLLPEDVVGIKTEANRPGSLVEDVRLMVEFIVETKDFQKDPLGYITKNPAAPADTIRARAISFLLQQYAVRTSKTLSPPPSV